MSVDEMARLLLVSKGQLIGLEHADLSPFYGPPYFLKALRRYMELGGLSVETLDEGPSETWGGLRMTLDDSTMPRPAPVTSWSRAIISAVIVLAMTALGVVAYVALVRSPTASVDTHGPPPLPSSPAVPLQHDLSPSALISVPATSTHP
jgi:hypothetical protein